MIYILLVLTVLIYFYLLSEYAGYYKLYAGSVAGDSTAKKQERSKLIFLEWVNKKKLDEFSPLITVPSKWYKYSMGVCEGLAKFAGTVAIACLFYSLLQLWLDVSNNADGDTATIFKIETAIRYSFFPLIIVLREIPEARDTAVHHHVQYHQLP